MEQIDPGLIYEQIDKHPVIRGSGTSARELINSGIVGNMCGVFADPIVARGLSEATGRKISSYQHVPTGDEGNCHVFMIDQKSRVLIDPSIGQFLKEVPPKYQAYFPGKIFQGSPEDLRTIIEDPGTSLDSACSSIEKKNLFNYAWGGKTPTTRPCCFRKMLALAGTLFYE